MPETAILLVDDEKTVLDSLDSQLQRLFGDGYEIESAESVDEAWEVLEQLNRRGTRIVVVVSDWLMPGRRGDEFLAELRGRYPGIGRILLTGQADATALERARAVGDVHRILFKPWHPEQLQAAILAAAAGER